MKYVNVCGYYASGSSAVFDLLKEYECFYPFECEIRFIQDPYGLQSLESNLFYDWNRLRSSMAASDYIEQIKKWSKSKVPFLHKSGLGYKKNLNNDFVSITKKYINSLSTNTIILNSYCESFKKNYLTSTVDKIRCKLERKTRGKVKIANRKARKSFIIKPNFKDFSNKTKLYMNEIFNICPSNKIALLDQALSPSNTNSGDKYFDDIKSIIVDRDPRDIYVENCLDCDIVFEKPGSLDSAKKFVDFFIKSRDFSISNKILMIKFEELVFNYDESVSKICSFLNLKDKNTHKFSFFNPKKSSANIGIWKKYYNRYKIAIDYINEILCDFCYNR